MSDRVPTRFIQTLLRMVGDRGYDFSAILNSAGLEFDPLDESHPDYRPEISAMQYSRVYQQVLSLLQDETFGVTGSEMVAPGAFRMMCYCIISCQNLGQAIQRASEFYRTFFDERSQLYANFTEQFARVGYKNLAREEGARVVSLGRIEGVGAAIRRGYEEAVKGGFDVAVVMAGNNKDSPEEIPLLLDPVVTERQRAKLEVEQSIDFGAYLCGGGERDSEDGREDQRARRKAAQAAKMNAASQPSLPSCQLISRMNDSDHSYITSAGARPNDARSARLSYSAPNSDCVFVIRATRPSSASRTIAIKIATDACSNLPCVAATMP